MVPVWPVAPVKPANEVGCQLSCDGANAKSEAYDISQVVPVANGEVFIGAKQAGMQNWEDTPVRPVAPV